MAHCAPDFVNHLHLYIAILLQPYPNLWLRRDDEGVSVFDFQGLVLLETWEKYELPMKSGDGPFDSCVLPRVLLAPEETYKLLSTRPLHGRRLP